MKSHQLKAITQAILLLCPMLMLSPTMAQVAPVSAELARQVGTESVMRAQTAEVRLNAMRGELGLDADNDFSHLGTVVDQFAQSHSRFQQRYRGIKIWGGQVIAHADAGGKSLGLTSTLKTDISVDTSPRLSAAEALAIVTRDLAPKGKYAVAPVTDLVIYPETERVLPKGVADSEIDATMVGHRVLRHTLAHHVHVELNSKIDGLRHVDFLIDAGNGAILKKWDSLQTSHVVATGARSHYNGTVSLNTNSVAGGYELRDMLRGTGGAFGNNVVLKYNTAAPAATDIFTDATNTWGDGLNYVPNSGTTSDTYQTPAVDVAYGLGATWDFYKSVFARNGIDNAGTATYAVVHDPLVQYSGNNAYWADNCYCMHYGDGSGGYSNFTSLDITGHELTHGVTAKTAGLYYFNEYGGLNEATSDIFGTLLEFYKRGGGTSTIPATGGNWTIGEGVGAAPFRYMYKPSLDGASADAWNLTLGDLDPHYSSGPMNRAFYFMSQGATTTGDTSTPYLPSGMSGVGNDHAGRIWYRTLSVYLTAISDYASAREGAIAAARDLYGNGSAEEKAVWNAFHGINVGPAWTAAACGLLDSGREMSKGDTISACNGLSYLTMQSDGNLVLYKASPLTPLWNSNSYLNNANAYAAMQADGNLVVYKYSTRTPMWSSNTYGSPGATAAIQNDGNMVITAPNGVPVWYVTPPAAAATVQAASGSNTSFATADTLDASKTGYTGAADPATPKFFRLTLAPGQTVTADLVAGWLSSSTAQWGLFRLNSSNTIVSYQYSDHKNTRVVHSYKNTGTVAETVYFEVYRGGTGSYDVGPFSVAIRYN
ncbi:MAG: M4 family metallopeptidase [Pseudomonadota bacterium]